MTCKNCNSEFEGKFCNYCGQSAAVQRINWRYLSNSIADNVFQINHGFLYTAKTLLISPGKSLNKFFLGKRKNFYNPFAFLLISTTLFLLSTELFGNKTFFDEAVSGIRITFNSRQDIIADLRILDLIIRNQTIIFLFIAPLFSIASFLSFRKSSYNFSEHLILNLYITGEQLLIYSLFSFFIDQNSELVVVPLVLGFLYNLYVYNQFFKSTNWLKRNLKFVFTYFTYILLMIISMVIFVLLTVSLK
ncbi:DUF3667 domain-containing protein [Psychroflexus lacisalsi]|jgi:hypothetical protein|uniref:DUF3667 domain-containing protein n=1 Tax=Psychroflexus lacisalsi TaxID=503928 RepID=UPI001CCD125E|nr:DUF3667 domain-containing protein [Psychroflexus lacisalsi]MBZ9621143.1 DUF3667 domain-containing protein [Psychroflexus lacisalsi]